MPWPCESVGAVSDGTGSGEGSWACRPDLDLDVILPLVGFALGGLADGARVAEGGVLLLLALLVLLFFFRRPDLVDVKELNCDGVAVEGAVAVTRARDL